MEVPQKDVEYDAHQRIYKELGALRQELIALEERYYALKDEMYKHTHPEAENARYGVDLAFSAVEVPSLRKQRLYAVQRPLEHPEGLRCA